LAAVDILPFFSMMFLHGGWLHLILNMWTLWLFGPTIEDRLGHGRYLAFYLACGLAASVAHVMFNPTSIIPALGASGAIAAFSGATCACFHWRGSSWSSQSCHPAVLRSLCVCLYRSLVLASDSPVDGGTPATILQRRRRVGAHVGGFIAGFILGPLLVRSSSVTVCTTGRRRVGLRQRGTDMRHYPLGGFHVDR